MHGWDETMKDCEEGLRMIADLRREADKQENAGRTETAGLIRHIAVRFECIDYGLYLMEYKHGIKMCDE